MMTAQEATQINNLQLDQDRIEKLTNSALFDLNESLIEFGGKYGELSTHWRSYSYADELNRCPALRDNIVKECNKLGYYTEIKIEKDVRNQTVLIRIYPSKPKSLLDLIKGFFT